MGSKHVKTDWRAFLPKTFSWLGEVSFGEQAGFEAGPAYVVPFEKTEKEVKFFWGPFVGDEKKREAEKAYELLSKDEEGSYLAAVSGSLVVFVSVSKLDVSWSQKARQLGMDAFDCLKKAEPAKLVFCSEGGLAPEDIFDGFAQASYDLSSFKNVEKTQILPKEVSFCSEAYDKEALQDRVKLVRGSCLSRMVADAPPNWMDSERFAEIAEGISEELGIKCTVWGREKLLEEKMGSFYSVAQGTYIDPKFIIMEIEGENNDHCVSLVGKGLTFDSGGINLKPSNGIAEMKYDMCGGAAVLGAAYYLGQVKPRTKVLCLIGAVENMPGAYATRPGDVVRSRSGKSIEILNTDAEGRLVLADMLEYVTDVHKPDFVIDVATLTGAVAMALGSMGSAILSNEQSFCDYLLRLSKEEGEPLWQLPMWPELEAEFKSEVADTPNIAGPGVFAGTITAAIFLKKFVGKTRWAHLDIAATGWNCKATGFPKKGATSFGLRTLVSACQNWEC